MISFGVHYRVQMFQACRNRLVCCELRFDGKRPDSATLIPWSAGKYLGCYSGPHLCCVILVTDSKISAGSAAEQAAVRKSAKYALLPMFPLSCARAHA